MAITPSGLLIVYLEGNPRCNGRTDFSVTVSVTGSKFVAGSAPGAGQSCGGRGVFGWKLSGKKLTLRVIADKCPARRSLFAGVWTKIPSG